MKRSFTSHQHYHKWIRVIRPGKHPLFANAIMPSKYKKKVLQKTHIFYFGQIEKKGGCRQQVMQQVRGNLCTVIGPQEGGLG